MGSKPLQGLLICGQFEITTSTRICARRSTDEPGRGDAVDDAERAVGLDRHVHEPVDVAGHVALAHAAPRVREEEVVDARVLVPGVEPVAQRVRLAAARAADGVVALAGRRGDRHHRPALVGEQLRAGDQEDVALRDDRVGRAVALGGIVGVVEDAVDGLVALEVDDAQRAAGLDDVRPRRTRVEHLVVEHRTRHDRRVLTRRSSTNSSVFRNARSRLGGRGPRGVVAGRSARSVHAVTRSGVDRVLGPGVEHVRRVGHHDDHGQLGPQLDVRARRRERGRRTRARRRARRARP